MRPSEDMRETNKSNNEIKNTLSRIILQSNSTKNININEHLGIRKLSGSNNFDMTKQSPSKKQTLVGVASQLNTLEDVISPFKQAPEQNQSPYTKKLKINTLKLATNKNKIVSRNYQEVSSNL